MAEAFQPIAVQSPSKNRFIFWLRCQVDLQLLTIFSFLQKTLPIQTGRLLDVGAGQSPWRELARQAEYFGIDIESADSFGMHRQEGVRYYDGKNIPFDKGFLTRFFALKCWSTYQIRGRSSWKSPECVERTVG